MNVLKRLQNCFVKYNERCFTKEILVFAKCEHFQCALEANSILLSIAWADKERHHSQNDSAKFGNAKKP